MATLQEAAKKERRRVLFLRTIGNFLLLSSLFMIAKTFYQPVREEIRFYIDQMTQKTYIVATKEQTEDIRKGALSNVITNQNTQVLAPEDPNFSIIIPKIGANARIIPEVDASDKDAYLAALQEGVAQAKGTAFPGEQGHIFLFAHSTDYFWNVGTYNAVFYLLYKLKPKDEIDLFYKGQRYVYKVVGTKTVDPSQVEFLTRKTNREFLTLQTCWPPGTTIQRLLVFATRQTE